MKGKTTKSALLMSFLSLLLCVSMLVGTTFAWFTDSVTSGVNKIIAGNLDVGLEYWNGTKWAEVTETTNVFKTDTRWEPGHTEVVYLKISNLGTLALDYRLGINIASEVSSISVEGNSFKLSDYIMMGAVEGRDAAYASREEARDALKGKEVKAIKEGYAQLGTLYPTTDPNKQTPTEEYVALVVYMPESVGNEANYRRGEKAPEINLGINLIATQETYENDSFNNEYDEFNAAGTSKVVPNDYTAVEAWNLDRMHKAATIEVPAAAVADGAEEITLNIVETEADANITVNADQSIKTYEVTVTGIEPGVADIKVHLQVGKGLTGVTLYHKDKKVEGGVYDANTGYYIFNTKSFSPFSVVYDTVPKTEEPTDPELPKATLTETPSAANTKLEWKSFGGFEPSDPENQQLEVAYTFGAEQTTEEMQASKYREWYCDFYVSCDRDVPAGAIFLGGCYGSYGWVGFENIDTPVAANTKVPLLGSVAGAWTYEAIHGFVGEFMCGVARTYGTDMKVLEGATFTVELRLTNPENENDYKTVETVNYTFPTIVYTGEELQDAINNGDSNISLGGDIDLSGPIVIPGN